MQHSNIQQQQQTRGRGSRGSSRNAIACLAMVAEKSEAETV